LFCSKCGAENPEGKKFCADCAAELGAARPAVQAPPPIAATPAQPQGEQKKAGSFWKSGAGIALIVIIGVVVLGGITTGIIFAVKGGSDSSKKAVTEDVGTDEEQVETSKEMPTEQQIGLPIYPNAKLYRDKKGLEEGSDDKRAHYKEVWLETDDKFENVVAWYKEKLSGMKGFRDISKSPEHVQLMIKESDKSGRFVTILKVFEAAVITLENVMYR